MLKSVKDLLKNKPLDFCLITLGINTDLRVTVHPAVRGKEYLPELVVMAEYKDVVKMVRPFYQRLEAVKYQRHAWVWVSILPVFSGL